MRRFGSFVTMIAGIAFLGMAVLIATGFVSIRSMAAYMSVELQLVVPALWLILSFNMAILGFILFTVALRPAKGGPFIVMLAALAPLTSAGLLARGIRFGGPVPLLLAIAGFAVLAAAALAIQVRLKPKPQNIPEAEPDPGPHAEGELA